ncbi:MAG: glycosyltransferase family 9 protein [Anaerolineae bacterium]
MAEFRRLRASGDLTVEVTDHLAVQAASAFMSHYLATGEYLSEAITLLCEIATLDDEGLAKPGLKGIFPFLVERLSDSFNPEYCPLYDRAFAQVVEFCRHLPAGKALDTELRRFGLMTGQDLLDRKARIKELRGRFDPSLKGIIQKVFVLSRVTLGAEIAVTSVVLAKMRQTFPSAELVLLAAPRMRELFGGDARVKVREIQYENSGGLIERLNSWLDVVKAIDDEKRGLGPDQYLIVDPDSRLTQLGLLPLVEDESRYYFFESRGYRKAGIGCISQLTVSWLNELLGTDDELYPYVSLLKEHRTFGKQLCQRLRREGAPYLVSTNFGVGGNMRKRIPDPFEERLLLSLIDDGAVVIMGKGVGEEELSRANRLIDRLRERGKVVTEVDEGNASDILRAEAIRSDVVTWEGRLGIFCALIAESDEYIGYDSAGQHIAAALGVPTVDIFADSTYPLISERWRPYGKGMVKVVKADAAHLEATKPDLDPILAEVMARHREIRNQKSVAKICGGVEPLGG